MFGTTTAVLREFPNVRFDYLDRTNLLPGARWSDRVTDDGTREHNVYNFVRLALPKLTRDLARPFRLGADQVRIDDTPVHGAVREAFINMVAHCDYCAGGVLMAVKEDWGFAFANPGAPLGTIQEVYSGGLPQTRNPQIQRILWLLGYGENIGSGFSMILQVWHDQNWRLPDLAIRGSGQVTQLRLWTTPNDAEELEAKAARIVRGFDNLSGLYRRAAMEIAAEGEATPARVAQLCGLSEKQAWDMLSEMQADELLERSPAGTWRPVAPVETDRPRAASNVPNDDVILNFLRRAGSATTQEVAVATGLSLRNTQKALARLRDASRIRTTRCGRSFSHMAADGTE